MKAYLFPADITVADEFGPQFERFITDYSLDSHKSLEDIRAKYRSLFPFRLCHARPLGSELSSGSSDKALRSLEANIIIAQRVLSILFSQVTPDFDFLDCPSPIELFHQVHKPAEPISELVKQEVVRLCQQFLLNPQAHTTPRSMEFGRKTVRKWGKQCYSYFHEDPSFISSFGSWTFPGFFLYFQTDSSCSLGSTFLCRFLEHSRLTLPLSEPLLASFFFCSFKFLSSLWHRFHYNIGQNSFSDENTFFIKLIRIVSDVSLAFGESHREVLGTVHSIDINFAISFLKGTLLYKKLSLVFWTRSPFAFSS
jgi:hypothetical protein